MRKGCSIFVWFLLVGLFSSWAPPIPAQSGRTSESQVRAHFFDSGGVSIHYTEQGAGEPVLLMHGFALNISRWENSKIPAALAKAGYRVFAVDGRGHGQSDKPRDPAQYGAEMARDLKRLLDHLGLPKAHVVGYSMGALITNKLRELHPERLQAAVLGGAGWLKPGDDALAGLSGPEIADSLMRTGNFEFLLRKFTANRRPAPTEEEIRSRNARMMEGNDVAALAAVLRAWDGFAVSQENLRSNPVPTLALIGSDDPLKEKVDALKRVMARLEVVVIDDADHGTALTDPTFVDTLLSFLSRHPM